MVLASSTSLITELHLVLNSQDRLGSGAMKGKGVRYGTPTIPDNNCASVLVLRPFCARNFVYV